MCFIRKRCTAEWVSSAPDSEQGVPTAGTQRGPRRIHLETAHFVLVRAEPDGTVLVPVQHVPGDAVAVVVACKQNAARAAHIHRRDATNDRRFRETAELAVGAQVKQTTCATRCAKWISDRRRVQHDV